MMEIIKNGFKNEKLGIELDVYMIDGKEWFMAKDISESFGYEKPLNMLRNIEFIDENSCTHSMRTAQGNLYNATFINEMALYEAIVKIRKSDEIRWAKAREFQKWVFSEVLPSLRKHNIYAADSITQEDFSKYIEENKSLSQIVTNFSNTLEYNNKKRAVLKNYLEHMFPAIADIYEQFLEGMRIAKMIDENGFPTDRFIEKNKERKLFVYKKEISDKVKEHFVLTNIGMVHLSKTLRVEDGRLKIFDNK